MGVGTRTILIIEAIRQSELAEYFIRDRLIKNKSSTGASRGEVHHESRSDNIFCCHKLRVVKEV